jgi:hypothetical protein
LKVIVITIGARGQDKDLVVDNMDYAFGSRDIEVVLDSKWKGMPPPPVTKVQAHLVSGLVGF